MLVQNEGYNEIFLKKTAVRHKIFSKRTQGERGIVSGVAKLKRGSRGRIKLKFWKRVLRKFYFPKPSDRRIRQ